MLNEMPYKYRGRGAHLPSPLNHQPIRNRAATVEAASCHFPTPRHRSCPKTKQQRVLYAKLSCERA